MEFFDANVIYGLPSDRKPYWPAETTGRLREEMRRAGVAKALVRREEQFCGGSVWGNQLLAADLKGCDDLWGVWTLVPPHTKELPAPDKMLGAMRENRVAAWQFAPAIHGFTFHHRVLKDWFELAELHHVPILVEFSRGISQEALLDVLERHPKLVVILSLSSWPADRLFRPFLSEFPNCHIEISNYLADGGLETTAADYGATRMLFGSNFQNCHFGGMMLTLKHAGLTDAEKALVAGGNLEHLLGEIRYA